MNNFELVDTDTGNSKYFDSRSAAEEMARDLPGDYKIKQVGENDTGPKESTVEDMDARTPDDVPVVDMSETEEKMKEGYQDVADRAKVPDEMDYAKVTEDTDLPERDLQEDPIVWLQRGSDEFVVDIKGTPVVTKKGWRVLQYKYDISTTSEVLVGPEETDYTYWRV